MMKRKLQRESRDIRKKILQIDEDHKDSSMQRNYGIATKTKRAIKIELFGSKSKSSNYGDDTSIEVFIRNILDEMGIEYVAQKALSFVNVDFAIVDKKIAIQVNGCYWHNCPVCYPQGPKNKTQRKNIEKDKQANEIISEAGYKLIEIWEHEIKNEPKTTKERFIECLK